ncbi:MAG: fimbrillin family protein [Alistipes sp.]|nr:fimbrillin family protein [Alistipes sp.]
MKKLFISLLAVAALASCAKEDVIVADPGELIAFNSFVENSTRAAAATDPSYSTTGNGVALTKFNVYGAVNGVNIFNGNEVTQGSAAYGAAWTLAGASQYWINGADYEFVAVVDGNKAGVTSITPSASGIPTSIAYTSDGATDLLCARVVRNDNTDTSVVPFSFSHLLSKVKFSVKNTTVSTATNYRIVLTSAQITGALASNTFTVGGENGVWTAVADGYATKTFTLANLEINSGATQYHPTELLLLPGVNVNVVVTADVQATDNGTTWKTVSTMSKTFNNVLGTGTLVANNAYHFAVELGIGTEIQFTATEMSDWNYDLNGDGNATNDDITLQ